MSQVIVIPFAGQEIGQGFNSATRESIGTALAVQNISEDPNADGQQVTTSFQMVTDQESLLEALGVSASVDARIGLFSGGAKMDFAESHAVNSFSSFIAGRCLVSNAQRRGHGFALMPDAAALVTSQRMDEFKTAFGDMFVRSLNTGGEFLVVARITSVSEDHQRKLTASLHGAYTGIINNVDFSASLSSAMQETSNRTEVTVWMQQSGGIGAQASFTGPDATKILQRLSEFPGFVHQHPVGYEAELANYNTIPIPVPTPEEREDRELVLADCAAQKIGFLRALSDIDFAISDEGAPLFDNLPSRDDLTRMKGQYRTALNGLIVHAIRVSTGRMDPPQLFVASPPPPAISFKKKPFAPPPQGPVKVPDFRGLTWDACVALSQAKGCPIEDPGDDFQVFTMGEIDQDGHLVSHPHDPNAVIVLRQIPDPGGIIDPRTDVVELFAGLRPGVPL